MSGAIALAAVAQPLAPSRADDKPIAQSIRITHNSDGSSHVSIGLDRRVRARVFTLPSPPRVVIDIAHLQFAFPQSSGAATPLVRAFRYGEMAPGRSRMVFDVVQPVEVKHALVTIGRERVLKLALIPLTTAKAASGSGSRGTGLKKRAPQLRPSRFAAPPVRNPVSKRRPVVVIDPGHGGVDPGAVTARGTREKDIVLAVARLIRGELGKDRSIRVLQTRSNDTFLTLDRRAAVAKRVNASLFVSLHADAIADKAAAARVRGATVYTLGEQASDQHARDLAEKENASDALGGGPITTTRPTTEVRSILFDLVRRESANRAARFREQLLNSLSKRIKLSRSPRRSAAFKVLKQISTPAVLVELGYMSNPKDESLMRSKAWQKKVASAIAAAIRRHLKGRRR